MIGHEKIDLSALTETQIQLILDLIEQFKKMNKKKDR
ncbi:hypothetical protein LAHI110946_05860 [Lactococcus hircilactis]